jgi:hypothetical protein
MTTNCAFLQSTKRTAKILVLLVHFFRKQKPLQEMTANWGYVFTKLKLPMQPQISDF